MVAIDWVSGDLGCPCSCDLSEGVSSTCEGAVDALVMLCALLCREGDGSASTALSGADADAGADAGVGAGVGVGTGEGTADVFRCGILLCGILHLAD